MIPCKEEAAVRLTSRLTAPVIAPFHSLASFPSWTRRRAGQEQHAARTGSRQGSRRAVGTQAQVPALVLDPQNSDSEAPYVQRCYDRASLPRGMQACPRDGRPVRAHSARVTPRADSEGAVVPLDARVATPSRWAVTPSASAALIM